MRGDIASLAAWGPQGLRPAGTLLCLRAMAEAGIAGIERAGSELSVYAKKREGKADLEASPVMAALRARRDQFMDRRRKHD